MLERERGKLIVESLSEKALESLRTADNFDLAGKEDRPCTNLRMAWRLH